MGAAPAFPRRSRMLGSDHFYVVDVEGIAVHRTGGGDVMSFVSLEDVGIVDGHDFLITIGHDDCLAALGEALGHASGVAGIGSLDTALGIADISVDDGGFIGGRRDCNHEKQS
jgi:hypothetical protein